MKVMRAGGVYAIGIDPGATGAIVILECPDKIPVFVADWGETNVILSALQTVMQGNCIAVIERQQYMPKGGRSQGGKSAFSLGDNYGFWKGMLWGLEIPFTTVPPQAWQSYIFSSGTICSDTKERSIRMARQMLPDLPLVPKGARVPKHGRSDAGLLALYAAGVIKKKGMV